MLRGCTIVKKSDNSPVKKQTEAVSKQQEKSTEKSKTKKERTPAQIEDIDKLADKNMDKTEGKVVRETEKYSENETESGGIDTKSYDLFKVEKSISFEEKKTSNAIVSEKEIYKFRDSSYVYAIEFLLGDEKGKDSFKYVEYFCPKKTYDNLEVGDSVEVSYGEDAEGRIGIFSVVR